MNAKIVVLGARGMTGRVVFEFLKIYFPNFVFGTVRDKNDFKKDLFLFRAKHAEKDFVSIQNKLKRIDYVINCIVQKKEDEISDLVFVNSYLPHFLSNIAKKLNFKLIHISTDAVFGPLSGKVNEKDIPNPIGLYGISKLLGEPKNKNTITIRTSPIGFNPLEHGSLLERVLKNKNNLREGFINQKWTGCTTLQFAKLCKNIISKNNFNKLRDKSSIFHFAPLGPITKYKLLEEFLKLNHSGFRMKKTKGGKINRILTTIYFDILNIDQYTNDIKRELQELFEFEKTIKEHEEKT